MDHKLKKLVLRLILFVCAASTISWGVFGHEHINHAAVLALPNPLQEFFYNHIDFITQESTVPDLRKYTLNDRLERPRHYINVEKFGGLDSLPDSKALNKKYDEKFLQANGTLPWYLETMMEKLTKAFKEKRKTEILFLAADLGHYLGDAHMPLHTSANHDGDLTNQKGIHAFWEAQLPDLFGESYNLKTRPANYIADINLEIKTIIRNSYMLADTLLLKEKRLSETYPADKLFVKDADGKIVRNKFNQLVHTAAYAKAYHEALNGMVENQMRLAIAAASDFWLTAWVNAGKPDLSSLDPKEVTEVNKARLKHELNLWQSGKLYGLKSEREFE
ncbi:S1/P1 Nuclease [Sphingobacteriaceae bacterium]|nr:S1/P1 Nuclease [Sphingobacteriaceae bacterium]